MTADRSQIQSVTRAIALLRCFAGTDEPLSLSELARQTDLTPSTALRLLRTLCNGGLLEREERSERYVRGPLLREFAQRMGRGDALQEIRDALHQLVNTTGESASFGHLDGTTIVVDVHVPSDQPLRFDRPEGIHVAAYVSAIGRALLAFGPDEPKAAVAHLGKLERYTPRTITSTRALTAELVASRERGYTIIDEEQFLGVRSVGVPVLDHTGVAHTAIGVQGPAARLTLDRIDAVVAALQATAERIARPANAISTR